MGHHDEHDSNERQIIVRGIGTPKQIEAYLPLGWRITAYVQDSDSRFSHVSATVRGVESGGWTLDDYVIPRLASGLYATEVVA